MELIEGSLRVVRLDDAGDPESSTYNVTFAPYVAPGDGFTVRKVAGDAQLEAMLRRGVGMLPEVLEDAMKRARAGSVTIPHVRLDQAQRRALRL